MTIADAAALLGTAVRKLIPWMFRRFAKAAFDPLVTAQGLLSVTSGSVTKALPALNALKLQQGQVLEVLQAMYKLSGRGTARVQELTNGARALLSRRVGPHQPILVVGADGTVRSASGTIRVTGNLDVPLEVVDIVY